jgi:hypothetical protein
MVAKELELEGYGTVFITPINIKDQESETVDQAGNPVTTKTVGERAKTIYLTQEGVELSSTQLCKKLAVEGEDLVIPKFKPTKKVPKDNITELDENGIVYRAIDRKFYNVVTDNQYIRDKVLKEGKSLEMPLSFAAGWKLWRGVLTNWNGKLLLVGCRGDLQKELEKYNEETVDIEIAAIPVEVNKKKLLKAMVI